jgi:hypothetical protein
MTDKIYFPPKEFDPMCIFTCDTGIKLAERFKSERKRADRAEAEVERLREVIRSAVESLVGEAGFSDVIADPDHPDHETWFILTQSLNGESNE